MSFMYVIRAWREVLPADIGMNGDWEDKLFFLPRWSISNFTSEYLGKSDR